MMNPENERSNPSAPQQGMTPLQLSLLRVGISTIAMVAAVFYLIPQWEVFQIQVVLLSFAGILVTSIISYFLIRSGRIVSGLGFTVYGFILGAFTISVFVERIGFFAAMLIIMTAIITVTIGVSTRRVVEAISASVIFGAAALLLDLYNRGVPFRLRISDQLEIILGITTTVVVIAILVLILRQFRFFSLRVKLISAFLVSTMLALGVMGYFNNRSMKNILIEEANDSLFNAASLTENSLRQFIEFNVQSVQTEANLPVFVDFLSLPDSEKANNFTAVSDTLQTLAARDTAFLASYALLDLNGNVWLDTDTENSVQNENDTFAFMTPIKEGRAVMSPVIFDPASGESSIYFSSPVIENGTTILGVLRIRYRAAKLQQLIEANNDRGGTGSFAVLFDENMLHLAHGIAPETFFTTVIPAGEFDQAGLTNQNRLPVDFGVANFLDLEDLAEHLRTARDNANEVVFFQATDIATGDLTNRVVAINMGEPSWILTFFQPETIFLAPNQSIQQNTVTLALFSLAGTVILALILTQVLISPIINLTEKANALAQGDFEARVAIETEDEIGELGNSFNSMSYQLQNLVNSLESQVAVRTKQLENRAAQLQASAEVARDATSEQDLTEMLNRAATLIHDRFGYYHVGIYMQDSRNEFAVLTATTDEPGLRIMEIGHQFAMNNESNVGYACTVGEPLIANGEENTAAISFNPMLPGSQAQLVLPLNLGNHTIGAIDLHSTNPTAFSNEEDQIFQTLADQLAIAIEKANVQGEIKKTLSELETAYGAFTQSSWERFIQTRQNISGYRINRNRKVEPVELPSEEVLRAWQRGEKISEKVVAGNSQSTVLAIPIKSRGSVISVLNIEVDGDRIPLDTSDLIDEISDRLSLILENARLIETAQRQVEREQLTNEIANNIRQSLDMDIVIRTAVEEIGQKLGLTEVELRLGSHQQALLDGVRGTNGQTENEESA